MLLQAINLRKLECTNTQQNRHALASNAKHILPVATLCANNDLQSALLPPPRLLSLVNAQTNAEDVKTARYRSYAVSTLQWKRAAQPADVSVFLCECKFSKLKLPLPLSFFLFDHSFTHVVFAFCGVSLVGKR